MGPTRQRETIPHVLHQVNGREGVMLAEALVACHLSANLKMHLPNCFGSGLCCSMSCLRLVMSNIPMTAPRI